MGTIGAPYKTEVNVFRLNIKRGLVVAQYNVKIYKLKHPMDKKGRSKTRGGRGSASSDAEKVWMDVAPTDATIWNRAVFDCVLSKYGREMGVLLAYDGRSIAYAAKEMNRKYTGTKIRVSVNRDGHAASDRDRRGGFVEDVDVEINHAKNLKFEEIVRSSSTASVYSEYLSALDVVLAATPTKHYVQVGRSFYTGERAQDLGRRNITASAWRGFYQSARLSDKGPLINLDESYTAFWKRGGRRLVDLVRDANDGRDLNASDNRALRDVSSKLKLLKVRADHSGITYRVHGFSNKGADRIVFDSDGRKISIADYFHNTYNIRLRHPHHPCVKTNPKRDTYLPMEVLTVVDNQRLTGTLSPDQTMSIVKIASTRPQPRREAALRTINKLNHSSDRYCKEFGLQVSSSMMSVNARVLPTPYIFYKHGKSIRPQGGQWRTRSEKYAAPVNLYTWAVINMSRLRKNDISKFLSDLIRVGRAKGVEIPNSRPIVVDADHRNVADRMRELKRKINNDAKMQVNRIPLQLIVVIKDRPDTPTYNLIKRVGDLELGVPSQVLLEKHCGPGGRGRDMYCDNVMLKINSKIGGQNSFVGTWRQTSKEMPDLNFEERPYIVLGADVTHPMAGGNSPSVAALVGSRDKQLVQFSGAIRNQTGRKEVISELGDMFREVYGRWRQNFKQKHQAYSVIMFRDGVSEGQFDEVMQVEISALRKACEKIEKGWRPRITYIIVTKRHHVRFFPQSSKGQDRSGNMVPGSVVDTDIVSGRYYDFYLNSHAGIQGTNKPSKYTVLLDENNMNVDALQGFIFRLTHGFVRCNRSVSMVNSAYYAHLLAFRGRAYLGEDGSDTYSMGSSDAPVPAAPRLHEYLGKRLFFV